MKETYKDSVFHGWYLLLIFMNTITIYQDFIVCFNKINPLWYCHLISPYFRISAYVKWQILCICSVRIGPLSEDKEASNVKCFF